MLQLLMLFHASLTEFSIVVIASTIVLHVRRGRCVYDDAHIPGACMATCSSMTGLFFHVIATDLGVHSEIPSVTVSHQDSSS